MQNETLKKYFLGLLAPADSEQVDKQIFEDEEFESELIQAENELIEEFLDGHLSNEEIIAFNQNFLITDERLERVKFIRLMNEYSKNRQLEKSSSGFFEKIKSFFYQPKFAVRLATILLAVSIGIAWLVLIKPLNSEIAQLNKEDLTKLVADQNLKRLNLTSENLRSGERVNLLPQSELTEKVLLLLALPAPSSAEQTFSVSISREDRILETISQKPTNGEVRLLLPKSFLMRGEYRIILTNGVEKFNYYFAVQ